MRRTTTWNLVCKNCAKKFTASRHDAECCSASCRKQFSRRRQKREEQIQAIYWWVYLLDRNELEKLQAHIEQRIAEG